LDPKQPPIVQMTALRTLSRFTTPAVASIMLGGWPTYPPALRGEVVEALLAGSERVGPLLDAIRARAVSVGQIAPSRRLLLMKSTDPTIRAKAQELFRESAPGPRSQVITGYQKALT